jgi:hypothetical protein
MTPRPATRMRSSEKSSIRITLSRKWPPLLLLMLVVVACCLPSSQGFGKSSRTTRLSKRLLWKELTDPYYKNNTDPTSGIAVFNETEEEPRPSRGLVRGLWRRGVNTSVRVRTFGIRRMDVLVRGGSSTNHPLSHLDQWARSLALSLAWVVSFQTLGTAMVAYRNSVCVFACFCASGQNLLFVFNIIYPEFLPDVIFILFYFLHSWHNDS